MDRTLGYEPGDEGSTPSIPTHGVFSLCGKVPDCESGEQGSSPENTQIARSSNGRTPHFE